MAHASYSRENGHALAVLGLAAAQSAVVLGALAADNNVAASFVSRRAAEATSEAACTTAGTHHRIPAIVRVASRISVSAAPVVCGALRGLIGAVAVDANSHRRRTTVGYRAATVDCSEEALAAGSWEDGQHGTTQLVGGRDGGGGGVGARVDGRPALEGEATASDGGGTWGVGGDGEDRGQRRTDREQFLCNLWHGK
jgi:hypothetical protein